MVPISLILSEVKSIFCEIKLNMWIVVRGDMNHGP